MPLLVNSLLDADNGLDQKRAGTSWSARKPHSRFLPLDAGPRLYLCTLVNNSACKATNIEMLAATVIQKTATKLALEHLWRSSC